MDALDRIANATAGEDYNRIRKGRYRLVIERFRVHNGHEGTSFKPELRIVSAQKTDANEEPSAVGSTVDTAWNVTKQPEMAPKNIKRFVLAVLGFDESQLTPAQVKQLTNEALGENQIFRGIEVDCETVTTINQGKRNPENKGKEMTIPKFSHVPGQTPESIARNRAALDGAQSAPPPVQVPPTPPVVEAPPVTMPTGGFLSGILGK